MKKLFYIGALSVLLLAACNGEEDTNEVEKEEVIETEVEQEDTATEPVTEITWNEKVSEIATSEDATSDKFYALEKFMMDYEASPEDIDQFKNEIIEDYKSGTYLNELDNHERMLSNIFKSYIVEKNSEGAMKDFAFDYHQNLKYTYRGVDAVDSEAVKSNEDQMNKALAEIE